MIDTITIQPQAASTTTTGCAGWRGSPLLRAVGLTLEEQLQCVTYQGGFVWPATKHVPRQYAGVLEGVIADGATQEGTAAGSYGPATGTRAWATAGYSPEGAADASAGAPVLGTLIAEEHVAEAQTRYPQFSSRASAASGVVTVSGRIQPIADLRIAASVVVQFTIDSGQLLGAWAWWTDGVWVGPRHTYVNGRICAFELTDGTWRPERGTAALLDLYAVWLARQIYLRAYGRWPGPQIVHTPIERLAEQHAAEFCGCGSGRRYSSCHLRRDRQQVKTADIARRHDELARRAPVLATMPGQQNLLAKV